MSEKKIVMFDSNEAAKQATVTLWQSRDGGLSEDERAARYGGCTHVKCKDCGKPVEKWKIYCSECEHRRAIERWTDMPRAKYDGGMLYSQTLDKYYNDLGEAEDDIQEYIDSEDISGIAELDDLRLVICEPQYARQMDEDYFDLPEDGALSEPLLAAMNAFNAIASKEIVSWFPGKNVPVFVEDKK